MNKIFPIFLHIRPMWNLSDCELVTIEAVKSILDLRARIRVCP